VGQSIFGSNFSTSFRKLTFVDFYRWPGFLNQDREKNRLAARKNDARV
jgi:hypothetical protein